MCLFCGCGVTVWETLLETLPKPVSCVWVPGIPTLGCAPNSTSICLMSRLRPCGCCIGVLGCEHSAISFALHSTAQLYCSAVLWTTTASFLSRGAVTDHYPVRTRVLHCASGVDQYSWTTYEKLRDVEGYAKSKMCACCWPSGCAHAHCTISIACCPWSPYLTRRINLE
jgi:hypothetical protein